MNLILLLRLIENTKNSIVMITEVDYGHMYENRLKQLSVGYNYLHTKQVSV